jgi:hypothetical protein
MGSVPRLLSCRDQARYSHDAIWHTAPTTFTTKRDADAFLAATRADLERGTWLDPEAGRIRLRDCAQRLDERLDLRPRTREQCEILLRRHIVPTLGDAELSNLSPSRVRSSHATLLTNDHVGAPTVAKCYRLLHAILATAVEDELVVKNPCVLHGAAAPSPHRTGNRPAGSAYQAGTGAAADRPEVPTPTFSSLRSPARLALPARGPLAGNAVAQQHQPSQHGCERTVDRCFNPSRIPRLRWLGYGSTPTVSASTGDYRRVPRTLTCKGCSPQLSREISRHPEDPY